MSANAKADIPPMDGPITVCAESIPSSFNKNNPAFDISSIDKVGKSKPYISLVSGLIDAGDVEP